MTTNNPKLTELLAAAAALLSNQSYARDMEPEPDGLEIHPWSVVIRLRRKPVILIDPNPAPQPPINRQGRNQ